jgi:hypothetical protein
MDFIACGMIKNVSMTRPHFQTKIVSLIVGVFLMCIFPVSIFGAVLRPQLVKNTLSNATPGVSANHEIQFRVSQAVPPSGKIIIVPETAAFLIPLAFDVFDIDFAVAVSSSSPYADRDLAPVPSATAEGVLIQTGFSGSLTFTLNSSVGLSTGNMVRIKLGTNASYDMNGTNLLINSDSARSYKIRIETRDAADAIIDSGGTMVAFVLPVSVGPADTTDRTPPVLYNGMPTGLLPGGTRAVEISLNTNEYALCRYATSSGTDFTLMMGTFPRSERVGMTPAYLHSNLVVRNLVDDTTYSFYVRCRDYQMNANPIDFVLAFKIGVIPIGGGAGTGTGTGAGSGSGTGSGGGSGDYTGSGPSGPGSGGQGDVGGGNYLKTADATISGLAYPSSNIHILLDGKEKVSTASGADGKFSAKILGLERGTYTFGMYAIDGKGTRSSMISSTVSLLANTVTAVSGILFPPTITAENGTVNPGDNIVLSGRAIPKSLVEIYFGQPYEKFENESFSATGTADTNGIWTATVSTKGTAIGNYIAQARSVLSVAETSGMSAKLPIGIGKEAAPDFSLRADLNGDGKVNLIDFSILLFSWGSDSGTADINADGKVDLQDFSIMIFYWTG